MKKAILSFVTLCAVVACLAGQDLGTKPADKSGSKPVITKQATSKSASGNSNAKYKIAMKYQPGMKYGVTITKKSESTNDKEGKMEALLLFTYYLDVSGPNADGLMPVKMSIRRAKMDMSAPAMGSHREADTDNPNAGDTKMVAEMMKLIGSDFVLYLDNEGEVEKIDGDEKILASKKKFFEELLVAPIRCAIGEFSGVGATWEGVNERPFVFGGGPSDLSEELILKLTEIVDSPSGKIAVIDMAGELSRGNKARTGKIRFDLDKQVVEHVMLEWSREDKAFNMKNHDKIDIEVKLVNEIPAPKVTSQPTSASRPTSTPTN